MHGYQETDGLRANEDREHGQWHGCEAEAARDQRRLVDVSMLGASSGSDE